jgi:predicted Rossmann-fold nucleotide-binding protein
MNEPDARAVSQSYLLPVEDTQFLLRDEMRAIRFALEYAKAELALRDWGIRSTIIVFGGARIPSPEAAALSAAAARTAAEKESAERLEKLSSHYQVARDFGRIASQRGGAFAPKARWRDNVIATGGGPGIMAAANRGAFDVGAPSIGFNITLPDEQKPNSYITPELNFRFHYFAMRKMHWRCAQMPWRSSPGVSAPSMSCSSSSPCSKRARLRQPLSCCSARPTGAGS